MTLTPAQRSAVERTGQDVCVVAGPGSGKTRVLVERFRWLVESQGVSPLQILTITFTEKAAYEIRRRLAAAFAADASRRQELERAPVGTIHAFCTRLLKENAVAAGLDPDFSILDERDAQLLLNDAVHEAWNRLFASDRGRLTRLYQRWDTPDPAAALASLYRKVRLEGFRLPAVEGDAAMIAEALRLTHAIFAAAKLARSVLDFDDLEDFSARLLESSESLRDQARMRYEHILMDEVQDTNPQQWRLLNLLRTPGCFFAVGDVNQAIYGFRHARPEGFLAFRREVESGGGVIDMLSENFRSRAEILVAAAQATHGEPGIEPMELAARRTFSSSAPAVECFLADGQADEAERVAGRILDLVGSFAVETSAGTRTAQFADIALLFRTTARFSLFGEAFHRAGIPYLVTGGRTLFERQEVLDAVSWLRVLANPRDEVALAAVLLSPFCGVHAEVLLRLREPEKNLWESLQASAEPDLVFLTNLIRQQRVESGGTAPGVLLAAAFDATGYSGGLDALSQANLARLIEIADARWESSPETPAALVRYLDRLAERGEAEAAPSAGADAVRMMTMHASKGLEFPIVFLPSLDLQARVDSTGVYYSAEEGLGAKWYDAGGQSRKDPVAEKLSAAAQRERTEESNRLLYVAMTRAEQLVILSAAKKTGGWAKRMKRLTLAG